jgi:hypothetical protein
MRGYGYGSFSFGEDGLNDTRRLCVVVWRYISLILEHYR